MDLSGRWRAAEADDALRRSFSDPDLDDRSWADVDVPHHWRSTAEFAGSDGPLLYRRRFGRSAGAAADTSRSWLVLDGLFYLGDVWLDGSYLGVTEGYFFPHAFEVTGLVRARTDHLLAVEVACTPERDRTAKRNLTGVFQHWDCLPATWNPGGIWRPVRIEETGPVRISRLRVLCPEASAERAVLDVRVVLEAAEATTVELRTSVEREDGPEVADQRLEHHLAAGENRVTWRVVVERPELWWPHALGPQTRHRVTVDVTPLDGVVSHRRSVMTGLRQVRMKRWIATVNGERMFLKGTNQGPNRMALAEAAPADFEADVALARDAGLDLVRVHGHVSRPELYDAADRQGMLLWQDLPLQWGYARGVRRQAARQAREAVDALGHHPSIILWCGHNEPLTLDVPPGEDIESAHVVGRYLIGQELPSFNKTILDGSIRRNLERADPTRPVVAHSGVLPHPGSGGTDSHLYFGWYHGDERDLPNLCARFPRLVRFVSEFGAQAVPESAEFMEPERWPDLDWERLGAEHFVQKHVFDRHVPPADSPTFDHWRAATQNYQADLIRRHVETLRRLKYRPTGGFCQFALADASPGVTWSVLDHRRVPKAGYRALAAACAPVIVTADRPDAEYRPGAPISLDVHVVSDRRTPLDGLVAAARLNWTGGEHVWRWVGDVPADSCVRVGTVQAVAPAAPGPLTLQLALSGPDVTAANCYESQILST